MKKDKDTSISSGNISINTENILPIVKRFLYSDQEIFIREIISNAIDATNKIQYLSSINEHDKDTNNLKIKVNINKNLKTIIISDNGIGMTENEVKKYINQIAFSGAKEFLEKYKDKPDKDDIIGFFGLGFYSCFMVSDKVEIVTKSYKKSKSIM
ncbi:MAG: ATP-binding protein [Cytophagales bacterium]